MDQTVAKCSFKGFREVKMFLMMNKQTQETKSKNTLTVGIFVTLILAGGYLDLRYIDITQLWKGCMFIYQMKIT